MSLAADLLAAQCFWRAHCMDRHTHFSTGLPRPPSCRSDVSGGAPPSASDQDRLLWAVNAFGQVLGQVFITPMPLLRLMDKLGFRCVVCWCCSAPCTATEMAPSSRLSAHVMLGSLLAGRSSSAGSCARCGRR